MERMIDLSVLWARIWSRRGSIALLVAAVTLAMGAIAFTLPPWYRAETSLLPPGEEENGFGIASLLRGIGVPGMKVPTQATPADVFLAVLRSRRINEEIVRRFDLQKLYKRKFMQDALRELGRHSAFTVSEASVITVAVEDHDRKRAADMANAYVEILDRFNREVRMTKGRRTRIFVETRLDETRRDLTKAEQRLADYQSKHKTLALSPEVSSGLETAARLYAQRAALEVRLGIIRSYTRGQTDEETQILQQLAQLDRQLGAMPGTGLELARMLRDVKTLEQLYVLLTAQFEEARIAEVRDVSTIEVLDAATPPERRVRPRRGLLVASAFVLSLAAGAAWAVTREGGLPLRGAPDAPRA